MKSSAHTYDEITRQTVLEPDGSLRPPTAAEAVDVKVLRARVIDAIQANGLFDIGFDIDGTRVLLTGQVRDTATRGRIERIIAAVDGVEHIQSGIRIL